MGMPATLVAVSAEQLAERPAADDGLGALADDVGGRPRIVVAPLDEQPLRLGARTRALEGEAAAQLLAVKHEDRVAALERLGPRDAATLLVGPAIPDDHAAAAELALEVVVAHPVVVDLDCEALAGGIERRPLR